MPVLFRVLLVCMSLLTSGGFELAAAVEAASCCDDAEEREAPETDCTAGVLCACCPVSALPSHHGGIVAGARVAPGATPMTVEPSLAASVTDIFHPPRA